MKYYKITGMNEGVDIQPFAVTMNDLDDALRENGDMCRFYEEITHDEYNEMNNIRVCEDCGEEVSCNSFTNYCSCGAMYNFAGQRLAPIEEWDDEDRYGTFGPQNESEED